MAFVAFDIETDGLFESEIPPSITCCAAHIVGDREHVRTFHSEYAPAMTPRDIAGVVEYLYALHIAGVTVVTFNGAGFDFRVVAAHLEHDADALEKVKVLARQHVDLMFEFACRHGYYASMNSFSEGCGLTQKTGKGCDAIEAWSGETATLASRDGVLAYCANDVKCLAELYRHIVANGEAHRMTKAGNRRAAPFSKPPASVDEAVAIFESAPPDCSWMSDPPDVVGAVAWLRV